MDGADVSIPQDVKDFVLVNITSVDLLETLLLLHAKPDQEWTAQRVSEELRTNIDAASVRLANLEAIGVAQSTGAAYRYRAANPALETKVEALARLYKERRVSIITLIYSQPDRNIRAFADAFRLKKPGEEPKP